MTEANHSGGPFQMQSAETAEAFMKRITRIHHLHQDTKEYPDVLQSHLFVISRTFDKIQDWLKGDENALEGTGYDSAFQEIINEAIEMLKKIDTRLDEYEIVSTFLKTKTWKSLQEWAGQQLYRVLQAIEPFLQASISKSKSELSLIQPKRILALLRDEQSDDDNQSTLTGDTMYGADSIVKEKAMMSTDSVSITSWNEKTSSLSLKSKKNSLKIIQNKRQDSVLTRLTFKLLNSIFPADITVCNRLQTAAAKGNKFTTRRLLYRGADIHRVDSERGTALHCAAAANHAKVARILLNWGAHVDAKDRWGQSPLNFAVKNQLWTEVTELLIRSGADVHNSDRFDVTPLGRSLGDSTSLEMMKTLLDAGANPKNTNNQKEFLLHKAVLNGSPDQCNALLRAGINPSQRNLDNDTPLHLAVNLNNEEMVKLLIGAGADVNALGLRWYTPLMTASYFGYLPIVKLLLDAGAKLELEEIGRFRASHISVLSNFPQILDKLLKSGAEVDPRATCNTTPLTLAAQDGHYDCAIHLLAANASTDLEQMSTDGEVIGNALACAKHWKRNKKLTKLLQEIEENKEKKINVSDYPSVSSTAEPYYTVQKWLDAFVIKARERKRSEESSPSEESNAVKENA